jgi:serine/threonine protein kinase
LHQRGIVRKDIKPVNILVDSASGAVWLTGFGIASAKKKKKTVLCDPLQWPFSASLSIRTRCRGKFIWLSKGQAEVISKNYDHGEVRNGEEMCQLYDKLSQDPLLLDVFLRSTMSAIAPAVKLLLPTRVF